MRNTPPKVVEALGYFFKNLFQASISFLNKLKF